MSEVFSPPPCGEGLGVGEKNTQVEIVDPHPGASRRPSPQGGGWNPNQSNRLDTDSSAAVRLIASAIRPAIDSERMLGALRTASVGWIESVMTSSFSFDEAMRVTAPPESTPWVM